LKNPWPHTCVEFDTREALGK